MKLNAVYAVPMWTMATRCLLANADEPSPKPSQSPSDKPSLTPSQSPSLKPSQSPSDVPSLKPSQSPSDVPSLKPSQSPSLKPSQSPSDVPSLKPSQSPSSQPSSMPSSQPSSAPSSQPSSMPSSQPSSIPSSAPSSQPSSQPSEHPSESPSCTPSTAPTDHATTYQYYADWSPSGNGCKNDGAHPNYMAASPSNYLYSTLDKCCTTHFGWNYLSCMGQLDNICARSLWYPDWEGANKGCISDGNEPTYMMVNPATFMYSQKQDCCQQHYSWDYNNCVGAKRTQNFGKYYPDFDGTEHVCVNDGLQPMYMDLSAVFWMHDTLKECCATNYQWNYAECIGSDPSSPVVNDPATYNKWYPDWLNNDQTCKNDNSQPAYMSKNPGGWMYNTQKECCKARYSYKYNECVGVDPNDPKSGKWFKAYSGSCVQSGDGTNVADQWKTTYNTEKQCCQRETAWKNCRNL